MMAPKTAAYSTKRSGTPDLEDSKSAAQYCGLAARIAS